MQKIAIKDLFDFEKGTLQSTKCKPGKFNFITASSDWKTHSSFDHEKESLVIAVAASGSLGRVHYVNGKFIASDLCFILTPKNKKYPIDLKFYKYVFESIRDDLVRSTATGSSKKAINKTNFGKYKLAYIDIKKQKKIKIDYSILSSNVNNAKKELKSQSKIVSLLHQQIIQDAISGVLTKQWRSKRQANESVKELLKKIEEEKKEYQENYKIRTGKKQKPVHQKDLLFKIPDSWCWTSLEEISAFITDGTHQTPNYKNKGRIFLSAQNIKPFRFMPDDHKFVSEEEYQEIIKNKKPEAGDILVSRVGAGIGEAAVIDQDLDFAFYVSLGLVKTLKKSTNPEYLALVINSPFGIRYAKGNISSKGGSAGNFNLGRIRSFPIPLPPLSEQAKIIKIVNSLLEKTQIIENQIIERKEKLSLLKEAILKESFQ